MSPAKKAERRLGAARIAALVRELVREASFEYPAPLVDLVDRALLKEKSVVARQALGAILANARLARQLPLPICQDTGLAEVFLEIGHLVRITLAPWKSLEEVISAGVAEATGRYFLRASAVDPLTRVNTGDNTPAIVHARITSGDVFKATVMLKGFGSENMSRVMNLPPGSESADIVEAVVGVVREAGANPCPPVIIGCGIGGTLEKAALLSKQVLLDPRRIGRPNGDPELARIESEIRRRSNRLGIGPGGLGGSTTVLAVRAGRFPTHIAGLPLAVNLSCWALRTATGTLSPVRAKAGPGKAGSRAAARTP